MWSQCEVMWSQCEVMWSQCEVMWSQCVISWCHEKKEREVDNRRESNLERLACSDHCLTTIYCWLSASFFTLFPVETLISPILVSHCIHYLVMSLNRLRGRRKRGKMVCLCPPFFLLSGALGLAHVSPSLAPQWWKVFDPCPPGRPLQHPTLQVSVIFIWVLHSCQDSVSHSQIPNSSYCKQQKLYGWGLGMRFISVVCSFACAVRLVVIRYK